MGSLPAPPPLSGLCSLPQQGEGQAGAPSPRPGRPPQDVKKTFSKQPGGRLGLALRRVPRFVEGSPPSFPHILGCSRALLAHSRPASLAPRHSGGAGEQTVATLIGGVGRVLGPSPAQAWIQGACPPEAPTVAADVWCAVSPARGAGAPGLGGPASGSEEQTCLLVCGGWAWHEGTRRGVRWSLETPPPQCITHLATHLCLPPPREKGVTPGAQEAISSPCLEGSKAEENLGRGGGSSGSGCFLACSPLHPLPMGPQVEKVTPALCQQSQGRELRGSLL